VGAGVEEGELEAALPTRKLPGGENLQDPLNLSTRVTERTLSTDQM
jgi:hypothetical protein